MSNEPRRRLILWRHGQTEWNLAGRFQGQSDVPLTEAGIEQADRAAALLASLKPEAIVSSDLSRAARTAQALADITGIEVRQDERLREFYAAEWQGMTGPEIENGFPEERAAWLAHDLEVRPGGTGETRPEVAERMYLGITGALSAVSDDGLLVVVSHGGAIRLGEAAMLGLPLKYHSMFGILGNCSWSLLSEYRGRWRIEEHNAGSLPDPIMLEEG